MVVPNLFRGDLAKVLKDQDPTHSYQHMNEKHIWKHTGDTEYQRTLAAGLSSNKLAAKKHFGN